MLEIQTQCLECGRKWICPSLEETEEAALRLIAKRIVRCKRCGTRLFVDKPGSSITFEDVEGRVNCFTINGESVQLVPVSVGGGRVEVVTIKQGGAGDTRRN